jgi:hypothetical protein
MSRFPDVGWHEAFRDRANADLEMKIIDRWFSTPIALSFGDPRCVFRINQGRIDVRTVFGFRAPLDVWQKFLSSKPPEHPALFAGAVISSPNAAWRCPDLADRP